MRILLLTLSLLFAIQISSFSQSCPTYSRRNNGNGGGSCSPADANNRGIYVTKTGHFTFSTNASNFTVNKVYYNNTLIQDGGTVLNGSSTFFGNINVSGSTSDLCFYGVTGSGGAAPAGYYRFEITSNSTNLTCTYGITTTNGGGLAATDAGSIGSNQTICAGQTPSTLTSQIAATSFASYKWQQSTTSSTSGFSDISNTNDASYSPGALNQTTYFQRVALDANNLEFASNVITVTVVSSTTWTGATNTTFGTTSNWNPSISPSGCSVTIPSSLSNYPVTSGNTSVNALSIASGATLTIGTTGNPTFSVASSFENNGTVDGVGTLRFSGSAAQTITGTGTVKNVDINNASGVTISSGSNKMNVNGVMTITSGTITTNDNLVFKASATEEGMIGQISTCATNANPIIGKVTVERYVPGSQRSFRFLTPGVTSTSSIRDNWQEGSNVTNPIGYPNTSATSANPLPGYGTHITGSTTGANGVDATITGNPSLFTYSAAGQIWTPITNTNSPTFKVGEAYQIMVRGDRSIDMRTNTPTPNTTIIRTTGTPATCNFTFTPSTTVPLSSSATGFSFIGNPYWAIVNWHTVSKSGIENAYYYWDPTLAGSNSRGAYSTLTLDGSGNETKSNSSSRITKFLQPGQGFFVRNTNTTPSITFTENDKVNNNSNKALIFQKNPMHAGAELGIDDKARVRGGLPATEKIYVSLYLKSNITKSSADGIAITYNRTFSDAQGPEDARKFTNLDENIAVAFNGSRYAITGMQSSSLVKSDTIPLAMWNLNEIDYVLRFDLTDYLEPQREIFLLNRTTGQTTKLNNNGTLDVEFRPNPGSRNKDDFAIVFNSSRILPKPRTRKTAEVFPNPISNGIVQFTVPNTDVKSISQSRVNIEVQDQSGRLISGGVVQIDNNGNGQLDISDLPAGVYSFKIQVGSRTFINKIVKQ